MSVRCPGVIGAVHSRRLYHRETKREAIKDARCHCEGYNQEVTTHWPRLTRFPRRRRPCQHPPLLPPLNLGLPSPSAPSICTSPRWNKSAATGRGGLMRFPPSLALGILISLRHANKSCLLDWEAVFPDDQYRGKDCCQAHRDHRRNNPRVQPKGGLRRQMNSIRSNSGVVKEPIKLTAQIHDVWPW